MYNDYNNYNPNYNNNNNQVNLSPTNNIGNNMYDFTNELGNKPNMNNNSNNFNNTNNNYSDTPKKSGSGFLAFIAFLEFLIIIFLCLYIANSLGYVKISFLDNLIPAKEVKIEETPEEEKTSTEVEITDTAIKTEIQNKIYYLNYLGINASNYKSSFYKSGLSINDLTSEEKELAILLGSFTSNTNVTSVTDDNEFKSVFPDKDIGLKESTKSVSKDYMNTLYLNVFGEETPLNSYESNCPIFKYSEAYNKYYMIGKCEYNDSNEIVGAFIYKFTEEGDNMYAYMSVGLFDLSTFTLYKDYDKNQIYQQYSSLEEINNASINESNYESFSKYKITFTKNKDGLYPFNKIEKME